MKTGRVLLCPDPAATKPRRGNEFRSGSLSFAYYTQTNNLTCYCIKFTAQSLITEVRDLKHLFIITGADIRAEPYSETYVSFRRFQICNFLSPFLTAYFDVYFYSFYLLYTSFNLCHLQNPIIFHYFFSARFVIDIR